MTRDFPLDEILTVTTGRLVARRHMAAVYEILNFLTGDDLMTHQLPRALDACLPAVLGQHPDLADIPAVSVPADTEHIWPWVEAMEARYGKTRPLAPIKGWLHQNPIAELCDMTVAART